MARMTLKILGFKIPLACSRDIEKVVKKSLASFRIIVMLLIIIIIANLIIAIIMVLIDKDDRI